jgi:hypothetical protein
MLTLRNLGLAMLTVSLAAVSAAYAAPSSQATPTGLYSNSADTQHESAKPAAPAQKPLLVAPGACASGGCGKPGKARDLNPAYELRVAPNCPSSCRPQPVAYIGETEKNRTGGTRPVVG